ncbi:MAG: hypothetical protein J6E46_02540, partial [Faecalicoccus sp.]|nr:hypothetical protein [Faecalicoccus sp.]
MNQDSNLYSVTTAAYPELPPCPDIKKYTDEKGTTDWDAYDAAVEQWEARQDNLDKECQDIGLNPALNAFIRSTLKEYLKNESGENQIYSPANLYITLSLLAEITGGDSQKQILSLLGQKDTKTLCNYGKALWKSSYQDDGTAKTVLANSVWMNEDMKYQISLLNMLSDNYYASVFQGPMGERAYDQALKEWIDSNTSGFLNKQTQGLSWDSNTYLSLISTIYFKDNWENSFDSKENSEGVFHRKEDDVNC